MAACSSGGSGGEAASSGSDASTDEETVEVAGTVEVADGAASAEADDDGATDERVETEPSQADDQADDTSDDSADDKVVVTRSADAGEAGVEPTGVGTVTARITSVDGEVCEVCLWLADDDATRQRGLMGVTDLGDAVGMAFVWEQPITGNFFMFQTPTPLSIAWFDAAGDHVGQADMEPCLVDDSLLCERYGADAPYVVAVEMFGGQLDAVGIGPGAQLELLDLACAVA